MIKHYAIGWACSLNDLFVRFPYEKCKTLVKNLTSRVKQRSLVKNVFRESINVIVKDIIDNNNSFQLPTLGKAKGEIHMEPCVGDDFIDARKRGKFRDVDFLESQFVGNQMYLYISGKRDNFLHRRKIPVYVSSKMKKIITENTNNGKRYG